MASALSVCLFASVCSLGLFFSVPLEAASSATFVETATEYEFVRMWPELAQPWYFGSPPYVAVDSQDFVYLADGGKHCIHKLRADGTFVTPPQHRRVNFAVKRVLSLILGVLCVPPSRPS